MTTIIISLFISFDLYKNKGIIYSTVEALFYKIQSNIISPHFKKTQTHSPIMKNES